MVHDGPQTPAEAPEGARRRSFLWIGDVTGTDSAYGWTFSLPDEAAAQQVLPLDIGPGDSYLNAWGASKHPMDARQMHERSVEAFRSGAPFYHQEYRCFNRDGVEQWLLEEVQVEALGPGRWRTQGICTDITDRKEAEKAAQAGEAALRGFYESGAAMMGVVEVHPHDVRLLSINAMGAGFSGTTPEALEGRWVSELGAPPETLEQWRALYRESAERGGPVSFEYGRQTEEGHRWIAATVCPIQAEEDVFPRFAYVAQDITRRKETEEALKESEERFREAMDHAPIGMAIVSLQGYWLRVNSALCAILGYAEEEMVYLTFQEITHPDDLDADLEYVRQLLDGERLTYQMEKRYVHKDGRLVPVQLNVSLVRDSQGRPLYFISQIQDITEQKRMIAALERANLALYEQSRRDPLTGLGNRLRLQEDLRALGDEAGRYGHTYCIALCDVDHFKAYNDCYGHLAGDEVLRQLASVFREKARKSDRAYRYGGEEFVLILPEQSLEAAVGAINRLRHEIERLDIPHEGGCAPRIVTISAGVAFLSPDVTGATDELLKEADEALYLAKEAGRNGVVASVRGLGGVHLSESPSRNGERVTKARRQGPSEGCPRYRKRAANWSPTLISPAGSLHETELSPRGPRNDRGNCQGESSSR